MTFRTLYLTVLLCLIAQFSQAQVPNLISYQAVARDNNGMLIRNSPIGLRVSIIQGTLAGATIYAEEQTIVSNANGLISLKIGSGTPSTGDMANINWAEGPYFIRTEIDLGGGTNYSISGASQLLTVPYALLSKNVIEDSVNIYSAGPGISIDSNLVISSAEVGTDPSIYFGNCLWPTGGILTLKNPRLNGDTRIYIMPNGNNENNVRSAFKIFGDDFFPNCDSVNLNYRDLGIYFNNSLGQFGSGAALINNQSNGKYRGKFPETYISFQDGGLPNSVPLRFGYYDITSDGDYESVMITGDRDQLYPLGYDNVRVFHANDVGMKYEKSLRFFDTGDPATSANIFINRSKDSLRIANHESANHDLIIGPNFIKHNHGSVILSKKIKTDNETVVDVRDVELLVCEDSSPTVIIEIIGYESQRILVYSANGNTTIKSSLSIKTKDGNDITLVELSGIVEFVKVSADTWVQVP